MLTRRSFLGACCAAHAMSQFGAAFAQQAEPVAPEMPPDLPDAQPMFICKTIDTIPISRGSGEPDLVFMPATSNTEALEYQSSMKALDFTPFGVAMAKDKWLLTDGLTPGTGKITLGVYFLNGSPSQQRIFKDSVQRWTDGVLGNRLGIAFINDRDRSDIRVAFDGGEGNWSYVGRANRTIPLNQKTMNVSDVIPNICQHEFGHAWCLQHEHQFPGDAIRWNDAAVIQTMSAHGWSESMTRQNILTKLKANAVCVGDPRPNLKSVMLYPIHPGWAEIRQSSGWIPFSSPGGGLISEGDVNCLRGLYQV